MDILAYISQFPSLTPIFYFIFQKCMQKLNYQHYVHWKFDTRIFFLVRFSMCKYRISLAQNCQLKIYTAWLGDIFIISFYFHYLAKNKITWIVVLKYCEISTRIMQITQKTELSAKRSTSLHFIAPLLNKTHTDPDFSFWF